MIRMRKGKRRVAYAEAIVEEWGTGFFLLKEQSI